VSGSENLKNQNHAASKTFKSVSVEIAPRQRLF
jgi:hypothetical protein